MTTSIRVENVTMSQYRVHMDKPLLDWSDVPMSQSGCRHIVVDGVRYNFFAVNVGNPHIVIMVDEIQEELLVAVV